MLTLVFIGAALVPVAAVCWVLTWLTADAVGGGARPVLAPVRIRNRR